MSTQPSAGATEGKAERENQSRKKWGADVWSIGYTQIPSLLFRAQNRLGLSSSQLNVILHLCEHWWSADRRPYPSKSVIANRIGIDPKQVQRILSDLEKRGYIKRNSRYNGRAQTSNEFDLSGLARALKKLVGEFKRADDTARETKRVVERRKAKQAATVKF